MPLVASKCTHKHLSRNRMANTLCSFPLVHIKKTPYANYDGKQRLQSWLLPEYCMKRLLCLHKQNIHIHTRLDTRTHMQILLNTHDKVEITHSQQTHWTSQSAMYSSNKQPASQPNKQLKPSGTKASQTSNNSFIEASNFFGVHTRSYEPTCIRMGRNL